MNPTRNRNTGTSRILHLAFCIAASAASAAVPVIDTASVTVEQRHDRTVVIEYTMNPANPGETDPAIVTIDILTNAVGGAAASVGPERLTTLSGDVNRLVEHTADFRHKILWEPKNEGFPEFVLPAAQVTARLTLWSTNAPPAYWVIDLTKPADRLADRYYTDAAQIPGTVTNILYKTDRIVFRRIPAKGVTWKMGSPEGEAGRSSAGTETQRYVTFSRDYWMAVFETTRGQFYRVAPNANNAKNAEEGSALPSVGYQYNGLRLVNNSTADEKVNWPSNRHEVVGTASHIRKWRIALGGLMADLPTSAEWEFACRAGTDTAYYWGTTYAGFRDYAWTKETASAPQEVGQKIPNAWGLYDMAGNVQEWCLDWGDYPVAATPSWDPEGPFQDEIHEELAGEYYGRFQRILRGGSYNHYAYNNRCRSAAVSFFPQALSVDYDGYRLCLPIPCE